MSEASAMPLTLDDLVSMCSAGLSVMVCGAAAVTRCTLGAPQQHSVTLSTLHHDDGDDADDDADDDGEGDGPGGSVADCLDCGVGRARIGRDITRLKE